MDWIALHLRNHCTAYFRLILVIAIVLYWTGAISLTAAYGGAVIVAAGAFLIERGHRASR